MDLVVGLLGGADMRAAATRSLGSRTHLRLCGTRGNLLRVMRRIDAAAVLIDVDTTHFDGTTSIISTVRARYPRVPIVGVTRLRPQDARQLVLAAQAGIVDVVVIGHDSYWTVLRRHLSAIENAHAILVEALSKRVPPGIWPMVDSAVRSAKAGRRMHDLAVTFGVPRRTVTRRFRAGGLPSPARLMMWIQVYFAVNALEHARGTVADLAERAGFTSVNTLRRQLAQLADLRPADARAPGSSKRVLERLLREPDGSTG